MTRKELHDKIADRIEKEFQTGSRRPDGSAQPVLDEQDCKKIADLVYSTIGQSDLGIYDVSGIGKAKVV